VPGLSAVATPPHHRRRGLVRYLLAESLSEYRERESGFCALWPFDYPFYRRFGWGLCSRRGRTTGEPEALAGISPGENGASNGEEYRFVECSGDEWAALDEVYRATNSGDLTMDRTEAWWRKRVLTGWEEDPYVAGVEREGELVGYLVYDVEETGSESAGPIDDRRMVVREHGFADSEAYRAVLEFCRLHDSQVDEIELRGPPEALLGDLVRDPREVEIAIEPGPMVRIVDVSRALSALSYPAGVEADLAIDVTDGFADWNDGRFRLSIADEIGVCEPIDADVDADTDVDVGSGADGNGGKANDNSGADVGGGADVDGGADDDGGRRDDADLTASIAALSQVVVGYLSVERAETAGGFEVASPDARATLAATFPPREPFLREFF
jgi:predicted acetyltransferase